MTADLWQSLRNATMTHQQIPHIRDTCKIINHFPAIGTSLRSCKRVAKLKPRRGRLRFLRVNRDKDDL